MTDTIEYMTSQAAHHRGLGNRILHDLNKLSAPTQWVTETSILGAAKHFKMALYYDAAIEAITGFWKVPV